MLQRNASGAKMFLLHHHKVALSLCPPIMQLSNTTLNPSQCANSSTMGFVNQKRELRGFSIETRILKRTQNCTMMAVARYKAFAFSTFSRLSPVSSGNPSGKSFVRSGAGCLSCGQPQMNVNQHIKFSLQEIQQKFQVLIFGEVQNGYEASGSFACMIH